MKYTARKRSTDIVVSVVAIALGLVLIFPVIYCVLGAFKTPAEFLSPRLLPSSFAYTQNFKDAMHQAPMMRYMLNSLIMATLGTVVRLVLSICAAFALTHYEFRGKNFCFFLILGTMMMPGDTLLITNYVTVSRLGLLNTYLGMCITGFVSASQMFMLRQKFLSVPKDLRCAAMIDGCGDLRYILTILMPICKPIITTLFVQSFITIWNAYLWPLIITASAEFLGGHQLSARAGRRDDLPGPVLHPFRHHAAEHGKGRHRRESRRLIRIPRQGQQCPAFLE